MHSVKDSIEIGTNSISTLKTPWESKIFIPTSVSICMMHLLKEHVYCILKELKGTLHLKAFRKAVILAHML